MASYLIQVAYTPQAWASLVQNPHDRTQVLKPVLEKLGGKFGATYFAFGEYDIIGVLEMPGNTDAAAFAIAAAAGGAIKSIKTTPLMTIEEGISAMKKAAKAGYAPPSAAPAGV
jgi:uncharacterized protein with GYD domain